MLGVRRQASTGEDADAVLWRRTVDARGPHRMPARGGAIIAPVAAISTDKMRAVEALATYTCLLVGSRLEIRHIGRDDRQKKALRFVQYPKRGRAK